MLLNTQEYQFVFFVAFLSLPLRLLFTIGSQALRNQFKTKEFVVFKGKFKSLLEDGISSIEETFKDIE